MSEWSAIERVFVGAAYGLTWATLAAYAIFALRRVRRAERRAAAGEELT